MFSRALDIESSPPTIVISVTDLDLSLLASRFSFTATGPTDKASAKDFPLAKYTLDGLSFPIIFIDVSYLSLPYILSNDKPDGDSLACISPMVRLEKVITVAKNNDIFFL